MVLKCNRAGCYTSVVIDDPYGLPASLVPKAIKWHEDAFHGHEVSIVKEES
jgi:hypothetical protein